MSTVTRAMTLGEEAHRSGLVCSPALDAAVMAAFFTEPDNTKADVLKAWIHGWHMANLKEITR